MRKNKYGMETNLKCFFCGEAATGQNKDGFQACPKCKTKESKFNCPVHNTELETRSGKYGAYFFCWECNKNWSQRDILKWQK